MKLNLAGFTKETPLRVAIADDHLMFRMGFVALLNDFENIQVIFNAENGKHALELLKKEQPDILFLDIDMPVMNGIETCIRTREKYPELNIVALSVYETADKIQAMVDAGVNGFLVKRVELKELKTALIAIIQSKYYFCPEAVNALVKKENTPAVISQKLSSTELDLMKMICADMTTEDIASSINTTVRSAQRKIDEVRTKINAKSRTGMVVYVMRNGYYK